jgi:isopenicillin N synthase-like dioxygenase
MMEENIHHTTARQNEHIPCMEPSLMLAEMEHRGYFVLPLAGPLVPSRDEMFEQFQVFDGLPVSDKEVFSLTPDAIGENNGWHGAGGLSRYNQCREGVIFQASSEVWPMLSKDVSAPADDFSIAHQRFREHAHALASSIMEGLASALELPDPSNFFTANGPLDIIQGSQFHVKKVMLSESEDVGALHKTREDERYITLRAHRDPSVISIVFHKCKSSENVLGMGLQFKGHNDMGFVDLVTENNILGETGEYCVVIAGSILELLSEGMMYIRYFKVILLYKLKILFCQPGGIKAPLHRVVSTEPELRAADRLAATFFFQPNLDCLMVPFPTNEKVNAVNHNDEDTGNRNNGRTSSDRNKPKTKQDKKYIPITYGKWKSKAYGSYYKGK